MVNCLNLTTTLTYLAIAEAEDKCYKNALQKKNTHTSSINLSVSFTKG